MLMGVQTGFHAPGVNDIDVEDLRRAKELGYRLIKVDMWWAPIEPVEGVVLLDGLERALDVALDLDLKVLVTFFGTPDVSAPAWAVRKFSDALYVDHQGLVAGPIQGQLATGGPGGYPGLCGDSPEVRDALERTFGVVMNRLKDHPALYGWDVWSEPMTEPMRMGLGGAPPFIRRFCYCPHTREAFRRWLIAKYGQVEVLSRAWGAAYRRWEDVNPPVPPIMSQPGWIDWKTFLSDRLADQMAWKVRVFKEHDPDHPVMAHTCTQSTSLDIERTDVDDWKLHTSLDQYGTSWYPFMLYPGKPDFAYWLAVLDVARSACLRDKQGQYFIGESAVAPVEGGPYTEKWQFWLSRMTAMAGCVTGIQDWPVRLSFPDLFWSSAGAFQVDGSRGQWADEIERFNGLANKVSPEWVLPQVKSEVAILYDPNSYHVCSAVPQFGGIDGAKSLAKRSVPGLYKVAWDLDVPVDFVHGEFVTLEELREYKTLVIPFLPVMRSRLVGILREYVAGGGRIVAEAGLGRFTENAWRAPDAPHGLQDVFGCKTVGIYKQEEVAIETGGGEVCGGEFWEAYEPTTGEAIGWHGNGMAGLIASRYGEGSTLLVGTMLGARYAEGREASIRELLASHLSAEIKVCGARSATTFTARLVHCQETDFLFVLNYGVQHEKVTIDLPRGYAGVRDVETEELVASGKDQVSLELAAHTARLLRVVAD